MPNPQQQQDSQRSKQTTGRKEQQQGNPPTTTTPNSSRVPRRPNIQRLPTNATRSNSRRSRQHPGEHPQVNMPPKRKPSTPEGCSRDKIPSKHGATTRQHTTQPRTRGTKTMTKTTAALDYRNRDKQHGWGAIQSLSSTRCRPRPTSGGTPSHTTLHYSSRAAGPTNKGGNHNSSWPAPWERQRRHRLISQRSKKLPCQATRYQT